MKKWALASLVGATWMGGFAYAAPSPSFTACSTTREYITTLEYLRANKPLQIPEIEARALARQVAEGCTDAARRFISVGDLLTGAGLGARESVALGLHFARLKDADVKAFRSIFQTAFAGDSLDLDLRAALMIARSLTVELNGDSDSIREDFERITGLCVGKSGFDLPRPECAALATRVAKLGEPYGARLSGEFIELFEFATSKKGPALITGQAIQLAEKVVSAGPGSAKNFMLAYRYAESESGLGLPRDEAIRFARDLSPRAAALPPTKSEAKE